MRVTLALIVIVICSLSSTVTAEGVSLQDPASAAPGKVFEWKGAGGLAYQYRVPVGYDPERGANLTLILHGSNLTRSWGFANHSSETFRPVDIVVCPDGTTPNGNGGFNSLQGKEDLERMHALHAELRKIWKVKATYIYGHSQGSFFAFYYAGAYPDEVQGVVGHASGVWIGTEMGKRSRQQGIVLMHGTQDPVVPYGQSVGGLEAFRKAGYPTVRLRSLEWWNHWPAEHNGPVPHTSRQLAWVEGVTTDDMRRVAECLELMLDVKDAPGHDYAGAYSLAQHVLADESAPDNLRSRAAKAVAAIEALTAAHVAALDLPKKLVFQGKPWIYHLPVFLRQFEGVPARDALAKKLARTLERSKAAADDAFRDYWQAMSSGKNGDAFAAGVQAMWTGFLDHRVHDRAFREKMKELRASGAELGVAKKVLAQYDAVGEALDEAITDGWKAYEKICEKKGDKL